MAAITGHVRIEDRKGGRVWVAKYMRAEGTPTREVLGPAWAKDSGRKTPRGAVVWRAADGTKPEGYLTPKDAQERLRKLLEAERKKPTGQAPTVSGKTFGAAVRAWLEYIEQEKDLAPTTVQRYRGIVDAHLVPEFGEETPLRRVTAERIDAYRERLLAEGKLSRDSVRQMLTALNGILGRAQKKRWIGHNPMAEVEKVQLSKPSGDFNVLEPVQVEAVARAAEGDWQPVLAGDHRRTRVSDERAQAWTAARRANAATYAAVIRIAANTGLRLGELRALRWRDVDWGNGLVRVRSNAPTSAPAAAKEKAPKSGRIRSVPLSDGATSTLDALSRRDRFTTAENFVFVTSTGEKIDGGDVRDAFYAALSAAGLAHLREKDDPIVFHDLRHTFGTLAVRVFPVTDVQKMMGHADIATTMRYVHYVPQHDAGRKLSQAFALETGAGVVAATPSGAAA